MAGPLQGVRVVDLGHVMAGPVCGRLLGDMGAEIIKVEPPGGDPSRTFVASDDGSGAEAFAMLNRGKRGIVLDLKTDGGRRALRRIVDRSDVLVENFRPGVMDGMGLGYDQLRAGNPGLVYCRITGFGAEGPLAPLGGFDLIAQGITGLMSVTGEGPGRAPVKCGPPLTDITAGILGALGVVAALHARSASGAGQRVDTSLFQAGVFQTLWHGAIALATGEAPGPLGSAHPLAAPYQAFRTADGWITIGGSNQATWERLAGALGREALIRDPRFLTNRDRLEHRVALGELLQESLMTRGTEAWLLALSAAGVPAGPVLSVVEMLEHPQSAATGMVLDVEEGAGKTLGLPIGFSAAAPPNPAPAPDLGQDTGAVLREHGFSEDEIGTLRGEGAIP